MAVVNLTKGFIESPKVLALSDGAFRLLVNALLWSAQWGTDGVIPRHVIGIFHRRANHLARELMKPCPLGGSPLWVETIDGYRIVDFAAYAPTKEMVEAQRHRERIHQYPRDVRRAVRQRDADLCRYCGTAVMWGEKGKDGGTFDHIVPGSDPTIDTLVVACRSCNSRKCARTPEQARMALRPVPEVH